MNDHSNLTSLVQRVIERAQDKVYRHVSTLPDSELIAIIRRETGINGELTDETLMQIAGVNADER